MLEHYNPLCWQSLLHGTISFLITSIGLFAIQRSNAKTLSLLFIESPKSPTGARLLGGLAISVGMLISISVFLLHKNLLPPKEFSLITSFIVSAIIISMAGYIDDKFEVRAHHKLIFQLISVSILTVQAAHFLGDKNFLTPYLAITFVGFLIVNGTNLLDGLDTLAIKTSFVTSVAFIYLGYLTHSPLTILISISTIAALYAFYFYNRSPAKIYLGEIGGSYLGLVFTAQIILCYQHLRINNIAASAISLILIAVSFPICELGISFLRRVYFKKSPFKGDKLHLHYIIKTKQNVSSNFVTNIMAFTYACTIIIGFTIAQFVSSIFAAVLVNVCFVIIYITYCYSHWSKSHGINSNAIAQF